MDKFNTEKKLYKLAEEIKAYNEAINDAQEALASAEAEIVGLIEEIADNEDNNNL